MKHLFPRLLLAFSLLSLAMACGDDGESIEFGQGGSGSQGGSTTAPKEVTARMETPATKTDGSTVVLSHSTLEGGRNVMTYCLEFDKQALHSRWIAFRFDGDTRAKNVSRSQEPFADDPDLSPAYQIGSGGFGGHYNRGHLCASADRLYSATANNNTFYMSNMSPQLSSFNQGYWVTLEGLVQRLGRDKSFADTLYVVKGGTVAAGQTLGTVSRSGGKRVQVPKYYFMALLKVKNGVYSSLAFWMEHKEYGYGYDSQAPLSVIATHAVKVNELERLSGINFFPNLPDAQEETVEEQFVTANWGL